MTTFTKQICFILNGYQLYIFPEIFEKIGLFHNQITSSVPGVILKYDDYSEEEINSAFGLIYAKYLGSNTYHTTYNYLNDAIKKIDDATLLKICYLLQELVLVNMVTPIYDILENIAQRRKAVINWYTGSLEDFNALKSMVDYNRLDEKYIKYLLRKYVYTGGLSRYRPGDRLTLASDETVREICNRFQIPFDKIMAEYPEYYYTNKSKFSGSSEPIIDLMVDHYL